MANNDSTIEKTEQALENGDLKVAVNSIQRTLHVERLSINQAYPADKIISYDCDNRYPNKVKNIGLRSGTTSGAIGTLSSFMSGEGFSQMDLVINRKGQTLWDILRHISDSKANFKGWALHFNYNMRGQITEINPINFETVRWHKDLIQFVTNPDWGRRYMYRKQEVTYKPFWPEKVLMEIQECGGIDKYKGQIYYWIPNIHDYYTPCNWDSVLDDAQFEAEAKLYSLSSIQNDYSLAGFITYPKNLVSESDIKELKIDLRRDKGSANAGGTRVIGSTPSENLTNWKWFNSISRNNIDGLHDKQKRDAKMNIYSAFRQPPILNGVATQGMFNQESFADAFHYYNTTTETERKEIERELNKIMAFSIWSNIGEIQIQPKIFTGREKENSGNVLPGETIPQQAQINNTLTNLTGRQLQGVFRITRKYKNGELTYDQASLMLADGFGFNEEQIKVWLVNDNEEGL